MDSYMILIDAAVKMTVPPIIFQPLSFYICFRISFHGSRQGSTGTECIKGTGVEKYEFAQKQAEKLRGNLFSYLAHNSSHSSLAQNFVSSV